MKPKKSLLKQGKTLPKDFIVSHGRDAALDAWWVKYGQVESAIVSAQEHRRRALAAARRKIRVRRTDNACPTKEQILDAWIAKKPLRSYRRYRRKVPLTNFALE